jgi:glucosylceramidase
MSRIRITAASLGAATLTVDNSAGTATYNAEYYVLGQASKFVKPGAVRIDSNTFGSGNIEDVAFADPDGSDALIVLNADTANAHTFNVDENGQSFTYTLPAKAVATFTWTPGSGGGSDATNGGTSNGAAVQQWTCYSGNTNQEWQFQPTSGGYYEVVTRNAPALGWDVTGGPGATGNGVPIQLLQLHPPQQHQRMPRRHQCVHCRRCRPPAMELHRRLQPELHSQRGELTTSQSLPSSSSSDQPGRKMRIWKRSSLGAGVAAVSSAALLLGVLGSPAVRAGGGGGDPSSPQVKVWITTADGQQKLTGQVPVAFSLSPPADVTVTVDPTRSFQTMTGFGGSITDSSAAVLYSLSPSARDAAMHLLFDPATGDGLDFLRQPIGASDFVATQDYTYDDMPSGQTDYLQRHFSIAHDETEILPLLREAERINPKLTIMATPWSPPAWMKTGDSLIGGRLIESPAIYASYALYLLKFVQAYRAQGVHVDLLSVQNEPQNRTSDTYPGTDMPSFQEEKVIEDLGPMLRAAGLRTGILAYDHNWAEHPNDIASTPPDETSDINDYPQQVLSSPAARWVSGVAYHCYYGDPSAMTALHNQFPHYDIYQTECSGSQSADPASTFSDTLKWHARNLEIGSIRNWSKTVVNWNVALDPSGGPHVGGCSTCTGILTVGPGDTVTPGAEYYALGHLSRFVQPGAVRIASTSFGTTGWNGQIMDVAFVNPDGSTVLVAHNENDNPQSFSVSENGQSFNYTLPGDSLATFVWVNPPRPAPQLRALDPSGWQATAVPAGPADPCCTGDVASNAVDDDASTRYSTGAPQAPGQYLQVDLGRPERLAEFVLDTGVSTGDYPAGYSVTVSLNGTDWSVPVATGTGSGQITAISLDGRPVRYVRVTLTAASSSWWSVADARAYVPG